MPCLETILRKAAFALIIAAMIMTVVIIISHNSISKEEEFSEKPVLTMEDNKIISRIKVYNNSFMFPIEYDYSFDLEEDAELIHVQATDENQSRKIWKFYRNTDSTIDLVIDFISSDETVITYNSDPAYILFKDVTVTEIDLLEHNRYLSCNNKWYIVDEVNASIVYTNADKVVTVAELMTQ